MSNLGINLDEAIELLQNLREKHPKQLFEGIVGMSFQKKEEQYVVTLEKYNCDDWVKR